MEVAGPRVKTKIKKSKSRLTKIQKKGRSPPAKKGKITRFKRIRKLVEVIAPKRNKFMTISQLTKKFFYGTF